MSTSAKLFNQELERFAQTLGPTQVVPFQKKVALDLLARIVRKTPVDTGRARGNWQTTINVFSNEERFSASPGNDAVIALTSMPAFAIVYITNNVPYIKFLEQGSSSQAANGMVAVSLEEMRAIFP